MTQSIHHIAQTGFSDASSYDKHRPTYTAHETDLILNRTNVANRKGLRLVDLAAGTGLFTEALAARPEGYEIIAVEPHDEMRRELEGKRLKGVSVVKGFAQELPIESGSVDGVFATQGRFATLESLKEIRRILKPDGYFAMIWHVDDWNGYKSDPVTTPWEQMIKSHIWSHDDNVPRFRHGTWRNVFDDKEQTYFETPIQEEHESQTQWRTPEAVWDRLKTYSIFSTAEEGVLRSFNTPSPIRPQLPFLSQTQGRLPLALHLRQHFTRLISTSRTSRYKRGVYRGLKISVTLYAILWMLHLIKTGLYQEEIEHKWPTPQEWSWRSRWALRSAVALQHPEEIGQVKTPWQNVYSFYKQLLERLEDPNIDGQGILEQEEGGILVDGIGKLGYDISQKSEPWRRGYFQCLINSAKAAEYLDGFMNDSKQRITAPKEYVHGPSNPDAKTLPGRTGIVMREEDCTPSAPAPEVFYMKILTTKGFTARQKIDAALAYADWLNYKGLSSTAEDMYTWAMDIATSGLPYDASAVVDAKTGILKNNGKDVASDNIMRVSTALGVHSVKSGDLTTALSIFTSVLKARRNLPQSETSDNQKRSRPTPALDEYLEKIKNMFVPSVYPEAPSDGNEPPVRDASSPCHEAGLMTYIGEILYASSSKETGLAWTRDAVDMTESVLLDLPSASSIGSVYNEEIRETRNRCSSCLKVGLSNWRTMVDNLVTEATAAEQTAIANIDKSWFGSSAAKKADQKTLERKRWQAEKMIIEDRANGLLRLTNEYTLYKPSLKTFMNHLTMTLTYPFDPSVNHTHMSNFQHRIRSAPSPFPSGQKLTLPKERWELEALYIAPQYQRKGYGMEALKWGIETAKREKVGVWVWSSDVGRKLYEKAGFEGLGRIGFGDLLSSDTKKEEDDAGEDDEVAVWVMRWRDKGQESQERS
ncbi:hypothetical protein DPV78_007960 [Talaromyces pinophilus]|nr:hypothetical protein DPV78_007960 [Talaromyces pinophilus]